MGLEPTSGHAATCFQDRLLIQPDDFRCKLRELESNQRPPGSEPGVATNSDYPASVLFYDTHDVTRFAEAAGAGIEPAGSWFKARRHYQQRLPRNTS